MSTYIIETRTPATDEREAGPWYRAGMNDAPVLAKSELEAKEAIEKLRAVGPDWAAAEYRYREATAGELMSKATKEELARARAVRPKAGDSVVYAEGSDGETHGTVLACPDGKVFLYAALVEWHHGERWGLEAFNPAAFMVGLVKVVPPG